VTVAIRKNVNFKVFMYYNTTYYIYSVHNITLMTGIHYESLTKHALIPAVAINCGLVTIIIFCARLKRLGSFNMWTFYSIHFIV